MSLARSARAVAPVRPGRGRFRHGRRAVPSRVWRAVWAGLLGLALAVVADARLPEALPRPAAFGSAPRAAAATAPRGQTATAPRGQTASTRAGQPSGAGPVTSVGLVAPTSFPKSGPRTFRYLQTTGAVLGRRGPLRRYRIAVERNLSMIDISGFAAAVDSVLSDRRSWVASGQVRLQRVPGTARADFTIYLATSRSSTVMCASGGVSGTRGYTSCRYRGHVVLNLDRWLASVPYYTRARVPLSVYRTYMVNHEVGHELGHGHQLCPGRGRAAPVMEQQTLGLHGCTPNPWPYVNGSLYSGPSGRY